jgi:hypothetical protein
MSWVSFERSALEGCRQLGIPTRFLEKRFSVICSFLTHPAAGIYRKPDFQSTPQNQIRIDRAKGPGRLAALERGIPAKFNKSRKMPRIVVANLRKNQANLVKGKDISPG